jgi:isopentenyl phosphate kinase
MENTTVKFNVCMNNEEKKTGNVKEVILDVDFEGVSETDILAAAMKAQVVAWQSQIRTHWDDFATGKLPKKVTFGDTLFGKKTGVKIMTADQMADHINMLPEAEKAIAIAALLAKLGK